MAESDADWWRAEADEYRSVGLSVFQGDSGVSVANEIRNALGITMKRIPQEPVVPVLVRDASH